MVLALFLGLGLGSGCASKVLKHKDEQSILVNKEFEDKIQVKELPPPEAKPASGTYVLLPEDMRGAPVPVKKEEPKKTKKGKKTKEVAQPTPMPSPRKEPDIEDAEGFVGRRPMNDPFRVGEKVVLELSYFGVTAGDMTLEVRPFVEVNGRKSYRFVATATSTSVFAMFYAVNDMAEAFVDYETLVPTSYSLHVKESKQLREVRSVFDWEKNRAFLWDKKVTKDYGVEEKKEEWDIQTFSQNVFSGPFYMRTFKMEPGKKLAFRMAHESKNYVVTGEILRREKISTPIGDLNTVVIRPKIEIGGVFQPMGEILFWLTDDDRKFFVKIESKIKIGKIVGIVKAIEKGRP